MSITTRTLLVVVLVRFLFLFTLMAVNKLRATKPPERSLLIYDCHILIKNRSKMDVTKTRNGEWGMGNGE